MSGYTGITNQGATCYLNSLLQALFNLSGFRNALFKQAGESSIVIELQRMFAFLSFSDYVAVNTKGLTSAFGWSNADHFEQHDIQVVEPWYT